MENLLVLILQYKNRFFCTQTREKQKRTPNPLNTALFSEPVQIKFYKGRWNRIIKPHC